MAQKFSILIELKEKGLEVAKQFTKEIENIKKALATADIAPIQEVTKSIKDIEQTFRGIEKAVQATAKGVSLIINQTIKRFEDNADTASQRAAERAEKTIEISVARSLAILTGFATATFATFAGISAGLTNIAGQILPRIQGLLSGIAGQQGVFIDGLATIVFGFGEIFTNLFNFQGLLASIGITAAGLLTTLKSFSILTATIFSGSFVGVFALPILFRETLLFVRRITGAGLESLTVVQRASRLVTTIDKTLSNSFFTVKSLLLTVASSGIFAGIFGLQSTLFVLPAIFNTIISSFTVGIRRFTERGLASIGSGRAALQVVFADLREISLKILPSFLNFARGFKKEFGTLFKGRGFLQLFGLFELPIFKRDIGRGLFAKGALTRPVSDFEKIRRSVQTLQAVFRDSATFTRPLADFIRRASQEKGFENIRKSLRDLPETFEKIKRGVREFRVLFLAVANDASRLVSAILPITDTVRTLPKTIAETRKELQPVLDTINQISAIIKRLTGIRAILGALPGGAGIGANIKNTATILFQLLPALNRFFGQFTKANVAVQVEAVVLNLQKIGPQVAKLIAFFATTGFKDIPKLPERFKELEKQIRAAGRSAANTAKNVRTILTTVEKLGKRPVGRPRKEITAGSIQEQIGSALRFGKAKLIQDTESVLSIITDRLPTATGPAKTGPLANLRASGIALMAELASGIKAGEKALLKQIEASFARLRAYGPASLPKVGPLRDMILKAPLFPVLWAQYAARGLRAIDDLGRRIGQTLNESIRSAIETGNLAERAGIAVEQVSLLDSAFQRLGASAGDLNFIFSRVQDTLRKAFTAEEKEKLEAIGISLETVRSSGNPTLELLLQVSDVLNKFPIGSRAAKGALDLLGLTLNSNAIPALRKGRDALLGVIKETNELGVVVDERFVKAARRITSASVALGQFRQRVINEFVSFVLPALAEVAENIVKFAKANSANILALVRIAAKATVATIQELSKILLFVAKSPDKTLSLITKTFLSVFDLAVKTATRLFDSVDAQTIEFLKSLGSAIIDAISSTIKGVFTFVTGFVKRRLQVLLLEVAQSIEIAALNVGAKFRAAVEAVLGKTLASKILPKKAAVDSAKVAADAYKAAISDIEKEGEETTKRLIADIRAGIRQTVGEGGVISQLGEQGKKALQEIFDKQNAENIKKDFKDFIKDLAGIIKDTPIGDLGKRLLEEFEKFRPTVDKIKQEQQANLERTGIRDGATPADGAIDAERRLQASRQKSIVQLEELRMAAIARINQEQETAKQVKEEFDAQFNIIRNSIGTLGTALSDLYELSGKKIKEFAIAAKAVSIGQAIIGGALAIIGAFNDPLGLIPLPLKIANASLIAAATGIQIAKIAATGFAQGGLVTQGTGPTSDDVMARLSRGEFVIPANVVAGHSAQFFEAIRRGAITPNMTASLIANNVAGSLPRPRTPQVPRFQAGGLNNMTAATNSENEKPINIVNIMDPAQMSEWQSSAAGQTSFLNVLSQNKTQVQAILGST